MIMKIQEIQRENWDGSISHYVQVEIAPGEFRSYTKEQWDELEAAKENGTIS
jgi:hypothetical protein